MLLTLTDHLTCPRCGPSAGLILLMERAVDRRVVSGALGCPVCRTQYPIRERVADLRLQPQTAGEGEGSSEGGGSNAGEGVGGGEGTAGGEGLGLRVAAMMELGDGGGFVLLDGPRALDLAGVLRRLVPDVEPVVAVSEHGRRTTDDGRQTTDYSVLLDSGGLPFADRVLRGAAFVGGVPSAERLGELLRVTRPTGRLVVETGGAGGDLEAIAAALEQAGASLRARDASGLVAVVF